MEEKRPVQRKRVTRKQLRNRRIGGLIALLLIIFLISNGCASCIRCACSSDYEEKKPAMTTTATTTTTVTTAVTTAESLLPSEYLVGSLPDAHQITIPIIKQKPELPTGSEVTSLAMVLSYLGYDVTKEELAASYLTCAERGTATFSQAFIGSPFEDDGLGCFAPVIVDTAQKYLRTQGSNRYAKALNADTFEDVLLRVASNHPVIIWINHDLELQTEEYCFTVYGGGLTTTPSVTTTTASMNGTIPAGTTTTTVTTVPSVGNTTSSKQDVYWIPNATCVVLTGYDIENKTVTVVDPSQGEITYDMGMFKTSYNALSKQAVIVY